MVIQYHPLTVCFTLFCFVSLQNEAGSLGQAKEDTEADWTL